jgi:hypothetical protein
MGAGKKMERAIYAWQRRAAPINIHALLTRRKVVRHTISTKIKYSKNKSITLYIPILEDSKLKRY